MEPAVSQKGYYDIGGGVKGARTDDELVQAILHRNNETVRFKLRTAP
jgi:hypothetical protein